MAAALLLLPLAIWGYPLLAAPYIYPGYAYAHERSLGQNVYDAAGRYLGVFPGALDAAADFSVGVVPVEDHKAVWVDEVPEAWWAVLKALEDAHFDQWRSQGGIDLLALCRVLLWDMPRGHPTGASTITMQVVRSVLHERVGPGEPAGQKVVRKLTELAHSPILVRRLGRTGVRRWAAMHLPLVIGAPGTGFGSPIYGVDVAGRVLFGRAPDELNLGEQALLAAAVWRPLVLAPRDSPQWQLVESRFKLLRARAARGLKLALAEDPATLSRALLQLDDLQPPTARIDRDLVPLLPTDSLERFRVVANPVRRALYFVHGEMVQASYELTSRLDPGWRTQVRGIRLSVDAATNRRFKQQIERELRRLSERAWRGRLDVSVTRRDGPAPVADVLAVFTDQLGRARFFYQNTARSIYGGGSWPDSAMRRPQALDASRPVASLGKALLAVRLAASGDTPETLLCNAETKGMGAIALRNPSGDVGVPSCQESGALYRTRHAMARSLNLPFLWRARQIPARELRGVASEFGLSLPEGLWPGAGLVLGIGQAEPATVQSWFHGIAAAISADGDAAIPTFTILDGLDGLDARGPEGRGAAPLPSRENPGRAYLETAEARRYARVVLGAPVSPGGTLEALSDWTRRASGPEAFHIGKSGTATGFDGRVRDLWVAGALAMHGTTLSYVVLVGAPNPAQPLGRAVAARDVSPLVRAGLEAFFSSRLREAR